MRLFDSNDLREFAVDHALLVYVVVTSERVKIGVTERFDRRFEELSRDRMCDGKPLEFLFFMRGGRRIERRLHRRFKSQKLCGEWYAREGRIAGWLAEMLTRTDENKSIPCPSGCSLCRLVRYHRVIPQKVFNAPRKFAELLR